KDLVKVNEPLVGNFSGIGVQFNMLNDTLMVIKTIANGPSEKVGILAGDRIIAVNNDTVAGVMVPSDSIVKLLKGPRGTKVNVGILRKPFKELLYFDITRDNIPLYSVDISYMLNDTTGYMRISKFSSTTFQEFTNGVLKLKKDGMSSFILDLRGNTGGYLDQAVKICDQFLDENELIVYTQGNARQRSEYRASKGGMCTGLNVVVIIDEGSASASEILAGAIQDNDRGTIVGRRSFGKGLVQEQHMLSDESAIRLTTARYYTPTGRCIQKPYENGKKDYYSEISERYFSGEMTDKDSIHFDDSLKFLTPGGKTVYGGGGIMPDVFVPIDTTGFTEYLGLIRNKGILYKFALEYSDDNRKDLQKFTDPYKLDKYLRKVKALDKLIAYAKTKGVKPNYKQIKISKDLLETELHAYIARNLMDNEGFYPLIEDIDNPLQVALDALVK
ncbi:MAG: S41 family peptidase, partial [Bacteroidales bacterium]|nr:S41 family peptidase [Bacteroidales bacterium]